jgi:hypothetical protein
MDLKDLANDVADAIMSVDSSKESFRSFQPGVGPYGEPQLVKLIASKLDQLPQYKASVRTKRTPDLLIANQWALEFKIVRPFGDNGKEAESWSVNLLHPYAGNTSTLGDCLKLALYEGNERKAAFVIGYEHFPHRISLDALIDSFEAIATNVLKLHLSARVEVRRENLIHPVHQTLRIFAWEVLNRADGSAKGPQKS